MVHFNWLQLIPQVGHHYLHVATAAAVTLLIVFLSIAGRVALGNGEAAVVPHGSFSLRSFFESVLEFILGLIEMVMGERGRKYSPMFAAIFLFVIINNLAGLLPGMTPATDNINTTVAIGLFSFLAFNLLGIKENGLHYFKHFLGPVWWLAWLIGPIELVSMLVRPMSLGLRLMGNMQGDHTVLSIFLGLVPVGVPVVFYCLGLFVCFLQAFIFTLLSMVYVSMATAHDH